MTATCDLPEIQAKDLNKTYPRSPREKLGDYILLARIVDKCRAEHAGQNGPYNFGRRLDQFFFDFTGIDMAVFKDFVASGANDDAIVQWVNEHSQVKRREDVILWNNRMRNARVSDLPPEIQAYQEDYIAENLPPNSVVYCALDIFDIEEGRLTPYR